MFSITTAEIRWFQKGVSPPNMHQWLQHLNGVFEEQEPRIDVYQVLPDQMNLGIKLREGRMEIKKRLAFQHSFTSENIHGKLETWIKWSSKTEEGIPSYNTMFDDVSHWIRIEKKRILQKFEITRKKQLTLYPDNGFPEAGIAIELANLKVQEHPWWTFALECFGPMERVATDLLSVAPALLENNVSTQLTKDNSYGYPEWIGMIQKNPEVQDFRVLQ